MEPPSWWYEPDDEEEEREEEVEYTGDLDDYDPREPEIDCYYYT